MTQCDTIIILVNISFSKTSISCRSLLTSVDLDLANVHGARIVAPGRAVRVALQGELNSLLSDDVVVHGGAAWGSTVAEREDNTLNKSLGGGDTSITVHGKK